MKKNLVLLIAVLCLCIIPAEGFCAAYPTKDITMIVIWPAGTTTDLAGRQLAEVMSRILGKNIIIQNVGGGSGAIGMHQGSQARPDGYTITYVSSGPVVIQPWAQKVTYDPVRDFVPVAQVFGEELAVVTKADAPYDNLKEMVDYFKKSAITPKYSTSGSGSNNHLATVLLSKTIGLPMVHVPFGSAAESMNAVIAGNVPLATVSPSVMVGPLQEGRAKVLTFLGEKRVEAFKEVPTAVEQGYNVIFGGWNGILVPKGTPKDITSKLEDAAKAALHDDVLKKQSAIVGRPIEFLDGEKFGERIKHELARNGDLIKSEGIGAK